MSSPTVIQPPAEAVARLRQRLKTILGQTRVPDGHIAAIAHARVFGPTQKTTPQGHPIYISSGVFDNTVETPERAIAKAAKKWHGIEIHEPNWEIELEADVIPAPANRPQIAYTKFYHMIYLPEVSLLKHKGLSHETMHNPFHTSYYLWHTYDKYGRVAPATRAVTAATPAARNTLQGSGSVSP